ncbi:MAG TPA: hypothetical protein VEC35_19135 [Noviherbaspirillum sp.]|nr:hypothetical protein [Noviherbaspirillum sp.]
MPGIDEQERNGKEFSHLAALRDLLDLPFHALKDGQLRFTLGAQHEAVVRSVDDTSLSLLCELGSVDRLNADDWQSLAESTASVYDPAHPVSLLLLDGRLVFAWTCSLATGVDAWSRLAEDALTWAVELQARLERKPLRRSA